MISQPCRFISVSWIRKCADWRSRSASIKIVKVITMTYPFQRRKARNVKSLSSHIIAQIEQNARHWKILRNVRRYLSKWHLNEENYRSAFLADFVKNTQIWWIWATVHYHCLHIIQSAGCTTDVHIWSIWNSWCNRSHIPCVITATITVVLTGKIDAL